MIERCKHTRGVFEATCDKPRCPSFQELDSHDFRHAVNQLKNMGWTVRPSKAVTGAWEHICPDCTANENTAKVSHGGY